jgi:glycyl-tRNA synthetase beta chain
MNTLLIEIGCEEIPAGYILPALNAFKESILSALDKNRIDHGEARVFGTPRRLALMIEGVGDMQATNTSTLTGPPERAGFDENGKPTLAAEKFAAKAGVAVQDIRVEDTPKGRYLVAVIEEKCESAVLILESILPKEILAIPFPKSMRWGDLSITFARPIISLVGLLGAKILDFKVGNIKSSSYIFGHPFMSPGKYKVTAAEKYIETAEAAGVIPDIEKRRAELVKAVNACAKDHHARILEDEDLVDTVTNLVESPFPVVGTFDEEFLEVPQEVLITAMREHQKYFALVDEKGRLLPKFIAVNNTRAKDLRLVAKGHEKVLRARLSDAKFFYRTDLQSSLDGFAEKLKTVTFHEKLGSMHEKTVRIEALARYLAGVSAYPDKTALSENLSRAAHLCKADLVSHVVVEFTNLQGIIGRAYALKAGEKEDVARAVEQHYRPVYSGGQLPENPCAALLAIADKLDTICGCFSVDLIPTGGADPYALRRQGIGIIQIMNGENLVFSLLSMIEKALEPFVSDPVKKQEIALKVKEFLQNRMVNILTEMGFSKEAVNSALWASFDNIPDVAARVKALDALRKEPDFEPLSITFKRVENIIRKSDQAMGLAVDENLFQDPSEGVLYTAVRGVRQKTEALIKVGNYEEALSAIAGLRPAVDAFFVGVMVMAEDEGLRKNRLALLSSVSGLFKDIADFSMI